MKWVLLAIAAGFLFVFLMGYIGFYAVLKEWEHIMERDFSGTF